MRRRMTQDVVERMVGHRTRLAQEPGSRWHEGEDEPLAPYYALSSRLDRADLSLTSMPRGWMIVGALGLAPAFVSGQTSTMVLAAGLGGVMLAFGALGKLTSTFALIAAAALGWKQVAPMLQAAGRPEPVGYAGAAPSDRDTDESDVGSLVLAKDLGYQYHGRSDPALRDCTFRISYGDRIHLAGPSGSGKSTLVSHVGLPLPISTWPMGFHP